MIGFSTSALSLFSFLFFRFMYKKKRQEIIWKFWFCEEVQASNSETKVSQQVNSAIDCFKLFSGKS